MSAVKWVIEIVSENAGDQNVAESVLLGLASRGVWVSAISVVDPATGKADDFERKYPLNVALVGAYAKARKAGE